MDDRAEMYIYDEYNQLVCILRCDYTKNGRLDGFGHIDYTGILEGAIIK